MFEVAEQAGHLEALCTSCSVPAPVREGHAIHDALSETTPTVVALLGLSNSSREGDHALGYRDGEGKWHAVTTEAIMEGFEGHTDSVELVMICGCESSALAEALVVAGTERVLCWETEAHVYTHLSILAHPHR